MLDSAVKLDGVAYQIPDELITHISAEGTTISPAILQLTADVIYTFKFVDEMNPEGVVLDRRTDVEGDTVVWFYRSKSDFEYTVTYDESADINTFRAVKQNETDHLVDSDMYYPGDVHKISADMVESVPTTIDIHLALNGNYSCAYAAQELINYVVSHNVVVRLIKDYGFLDGETKEAYTASAVLGKYDRSGFAGVDILFNQFDGSNNAWTCYKVTLNTDGTVTGTKYTKTLTTT